VLALALALDRGKQVDEARALLLERVHGDPRRVVLSEGSKETLAVDAGEGPALVALALEMTDAAGARDAWEAYLAGSADGPWSAHARAHLAALTARRAAQRGPR
jgi:hypothetical protein